MLDNLHRKRNPLGFKHVIKRSAGCGTCMCLSFNAVLMHFGHHSVIVMAFAALCSWVSYMISDPAMDQLTESIARLEKSMESNAAAFRRDIENLRCDVGEDMVKMEARMQARLQGTLLALERRVNARFDNLHVSLGTAPGTPAGIDEDVMADLDIYAHDCRDDSELRERIAGAFTEDNI